MRTETAPLDRDNPQTIANRLKIRRDNPKTKNQAFLLVEGSSDQNVFKTYIDDQCCYIAVAYGKLNVVDILNKLEKMGVKGALAIVDSDFDLFLSKLLNIDDLIYTDTHDLDTMILQSPALGRLLEHYKVLGGNCALLREALLRCAKPLGHLRLLNERQDLKLNFKSLDAEDFDYFFDREKFTVNVGRMIEKVHQKSQTNLSAYEIESRLNRILKTSADDLWILCCGHDMVEFLALILSKWCGHDIYRRINNELSDMVNIPRCDSLEDRLYLAWDCVFFYETKLHKSIKLWEVTNAPMKVYKRYDS